ncbi:transglycosylase domain-containing protein [bacterium]|nr:transglycosylase domain-containing protein [bacterium]
MRVMIFRPSNLQTAIFFALCVTVVGIVVVSGFLVIGNLVWMERQIDEITWQLPATIYAEPPTISPGKVISKDWLIQYLQRLNYVETSAKNIQPGQYVYTKRGVLFRKRPLANEETKPVLVTFNNTKIQKIVDAADNMRVDHYTLEPTPLATLFGSEWEKRTLVKIEDLPKHVLDAVVAVEDRRFYKHSGVDVASIGRAFLNNLRDEGPFQGGSTITQQLVKNLYLTPEKTVRRKMSEAAMAVLMEAKYSKDEILEFYLNEIYLGQQGPVSIKGIGEASKLYFKKDARLLTIPEAATLAGLIQAPSRYDPYRHPEKAKLRRDSVLLAMKDVGSLSSKDCEKYMSSSLEIKQPDRAHNRAPYFLTYLKKQLKEQFSSKALHEEDYRIISTLDYDMQLAAQQALSEGLASIDKVRGKRVRGRVQGSLIAIEATTGKIRAFVGGRNFSGSQFDRLTQAHRQPGSSFKPFVYAAALETAFDSQSRFYTTSSLVADEPWSIQIDRATWQPQNYNGSFNGIVSLRTALAKSMNIATAKLAYDVGFSNEQ